MKGRTNLDTLILGEKWHTKGMAVLDDILIVGIGEEGDLHHRFVSESHIVFISLPDLTCTNSYVLKHPVEGFLGNINEIRVL